MRVVENENGKVTYLNSGDWVEHLTALEFYNNAWHMYTYDDKAFESAKVVDMHKKVASPDVVTDEIALFVRSVSQSFQSVPGQVAFSKPF